jgi:hypothetical protein
VAGTCEYGKEASGVNKNAGNFLTSCRDWLASQEGLRSMEEVSNSPPSQVTDLRKDYQTTLSKMYKVKDNIDNSYIKY